MAYRQKEYNYNDKLTKNQNLLMDKLYKMRMSGMAEAFENQLMNPNSGLESFETRFSEIINHEWLGRENKKFNRLLKQATLKYPAADLDSSLYDPERQLNTHVIELLAKGDWIDEPNNLLITGGAGAGKTHVACALCLTALPQMRTTRSVMDRFRIGSSSLICFKNPPMHIVKIITMSIQTRWPVMIFLL